MTRPADIYWDFEKDVLVFYWLTGAKVVSAIAGAGFSRDQDYHKRYQSGYTHWSEIVPLNEGLKLWLMLNEWDLP